LRTRKDVAMDLGPRSGACQ